MKEITEVHKLYEFSELSDAAKQKALEILRYTNVDYDWWDYDGHMGFSADEIRKHHLTEDESKHELVKFKELHFDLDRAAYVQFDGAQFSNDETARKYLGVPKSIWERTDWSFSNVCHGGNNCNSTELEYEWRGDHDLTPRQSAILDRAVERFKDKVHECYRNLQQSYDYLTSDEAIKESIEANEFEFTETGHFPPRWK